jgi:lactoylglutathione lyase
MRYLHTMVRVKNLESALSFYCEALGLYEVRRYDDEKGRYTLVFLSAPEDKAQATPSEDRRGGAQIELTYNWPDADGKLEIYDGGRNFGHLAYEVDDIYATCQRLIDKGVLINRPPKDGRMAFVRSPDGISIELLQKGAALAPQEPWVSMVNQGQW